MTLESILIIIAIFAVSALIKGWSGFGTNLLAMPMLVFLGYELKEAVTIVITVNVFMNIAILVENKKFNFDALKEIWVLIIFGVSFTFVGSYFLKSGDPNILKIIIGVVIILTVLNKALKLKFVITNKEKYYIPVGIISGLFNGMAGLGGLPVLILLSNSDMPRDKFRTTLVSYFLVMNIIVVFSSLYSGFYTSFVLTNIGIVLLIGVAFCMFGVYLSRRVSDVIFQRVMLVMLLFMGVNLMYNGITNLM